jgi:hypothetical protein
MMGRHSLERRHRSRSEETNSAEDQTWVRVLFPCQETSDLMGVPESLEGIMSTCLLSRLIYLTVMVFHWSPVIGLRRRWSLWARLVSTYIGDHHARSHSPSVSCLIILSPCPRHPRYQQSPCETSINEDPRSSKSSWMRQ